MVEAGCIYLFLIFEEKAMTASISLRSLLGRPQDPDLADQAVPGHGVPLQDPDQAAQIRMGKAEALRESKSTMVAGFMIFGAALGSAAGAAVGGPVGIFVGGAVGGLVGAGCGEAAGATWIKHKD